MTGRLGDCAVWDCAEPATVAFSIRDQPVAFVCESHDVALRDRKGWVLRTGLGAVPLLYPPGSTIPPL